MCIDLLFLGSLSHQYLEFTEDVPLSQRVVELERRMAALEAEVRNPEKVVTSV